MASPKINVGTRIPRIALATLVALSMLLIGLPGTAAATTDDCAAINDTSDDMSVEEAEQRCELDHTFTDIGNFITFIVVAIAVPNGAYGFLEWMTANDSVEKDDRGRRRIRNTFIALGGVGILRIAVEMMKLFIPGL